MAKRIVALVAGAMVMAAVVLVGLALWQNLSGPREFRPAKVGSQPAKPDAGNQAARGASAAKKKSESEGLSPPPVAPGSPEVGKQYTLADAEKAMDTARSKKAAIPQYRDALDSWYNVLADPSFTQSADYAEHVEKLKKQAAEAAESATLWIAIAKATLHLAWHERGWGPEELVAEKSRQHFIARAREAQAAIQQALNIGVKDGEAYSVLLEIAKIEGWPLDTTRAAFDEGCRLDPRDYDLYQAMAEYLLPVWHGQPGDVERFARESFQSIGGDEGLDLYLQIAYALNQFDSNLLFWGDFDRPLLARAAVVGVERYPTARNLVPFAALCTIVAQDRAAARKIRPAVKTKEAQRVWLWSHVAEDFFRWCDETKSFDQVPTEWLWGAPLNYPSVVFAADSKRLWCASGFGASAVIQWDWQQRTAETALPVRNKRIGVLAVDHGKNWVAATLAGEGDAGWMLWQKPERNSEPYVCETTDACAAIAIHPKLPRVAFAVRDEVRVMDMESKEERAPIRANDEVRGIRFSDDGTLVAVWGQKTAVYDAATGTRQYELPSAGDIPSAATDEIGHACEQVVGFDSEGRVWAIAFAINSRPVKRSLVRFSPNGKSLEQVIPDLQGSGGVQPLTAVLSPDHRQLAISSEVQKIEDPEDICIWDVATGQSRQFYGSHDHIGSFAFSPDGRWLASVSQTGGPVKIWELK
ncbi:MAG TPA: hypothetical protein VGI40_28595 [Pirellulaceae bacterium]